MANYYLCPDAFDKTGNIARDFPSRCLGWAKECVQQGKSYLRMQPAYPYIQEGLDLVNGELFAQSSTAISDATTDLVVRNLKELVAAQTNLRIIPSFSTEDDRYEDQQAPLNSLYMGWQLATFADRTLRKTWQYATACGTGYAGLRWDPKYWRNGKGEIVLDSYGPMDVLPVGLPRNHELAKSYAVVVKVETPIHELLDLYPEFRDRIKPTAYSKPGLGNTGSMLSSVFRRFGLGSMSDRDPVPWPTVWVYHIYIQDSSINISGKARLMGDPGASYSYQVPSKGTQVELGEDAAGNPVYRDATLEDCRLYPNGRLVICTDDVVLNPDPHLQVNPYWHGRPPVVQFRSDDWPWSFLGFPLTKSGLSLERANIELLRNTVDSLNGRLSPPMSYDRSLISDALGETINPRIPNQVIGLDFNAEAMKPLMPPEYYSVPANLPLIMEQNERRITHQMGVQDALALARVRQMPSEDSMERIMDAMGPLIKDQSRNMEIGIRDLGEMWKYNAFQFYTNPRWIEYVGQDNVPARQKFVPESISPVRDTDYKTAPRSVTSKRHASVFTFSVTPYSIHEINSVTRKLFHLQLVRSGFPIDWWTLADVFDIHNFGSKPKSPDGEEIQTVLERWIAQKEIEVRFAMALQGATGGGPAAGPGQGMGGGRPPSGQNPPALEQKSDGRSIIRESKK